MVGTNNETNQQAEIKRLAAKLSKEQIAPYAAEIDRLGTFPWEAMAIVTTALSSGFSEARGD
jgi:hypothetical protein